MPVELQGFKHLLSDHRSLEEGSFTIEHPYKITSLPVEVLRSGKYQPRLSFDDQGLQELSNSIKANGIIQPLIVRAVFEDKKKLYEIIAGERRWRAAKIASLKEVPAIIHDISDDTALVFALVENVQREDLNPMDRVCALVRLQDEFSLTHEKIAEIIGLSRSSVTNLIRLSMLPDEIKCSIQNGEISVGHAKALLSLEEHQQLDIAREIVRKKLSARAVEELAQKTKFSLVNKEEVGFLDDEIKRWSQILSECTLSEAKVHLNKGGQGRVVIKIGSLDELKILVERFK